MERKKERDIFLKEIKNIQTPAHIIDLNQIEINFDNINLLKERTNCKIFFALKGFSNAIILSHFIKQLDGLSASGSFESRLGKEFDMKINTFSTVYTENNIEEIVENSDYLIFNSMNQYKKYLNLAKKEKCSIGIRINPEYTELPDDFGANTCKKDSHLGIRKKDMPPIDDFQEGKIEGIHLHTMCEQGADTLERTINYLIDNYDIYLKRIKWINLGGGQLIAEQNYDIEKAIKAIERLKNKYSIDIILEPCEGIMLNSGYYVASVVDIIKNEIDTAILDGSAICHIPDCAYRGWTRDIYNAICIEDKDDINKYDNVYKLAGCSCYAGDTFGIYSFNKELKVGNKLIFEDTSSYTMVKSSMFNGIPLPRLYSFSLDKKLIKCKEYDYSNYKELFSNRDDHEFLNKTHTEELVVRTKSEPSAENAIGILREFAKYPNTVKLSDVNAIVEYAMKSNVSVQEIAEALNENGFNIQASTIVDEEVEQFRTFGITGLKATCMHKHLMEDESFVFLKLITDADKEDTTLEFRRVFEEIKEQREEREKEGRYIPDNLKQFDELGHIILDWKYPELLFRDVTPEIQELVKGQAINNFDRFDPDHGSYKLRDDKNTACTYRVLSEARLMDKNTYIALYQKALNRNYNLKEFDQSIYYREIDEEARKEARQEILQNAYYPYPKKSWQKSHSLEEDHRISKVAIPQELIQKGEVRNRIKQEIIKQGIARKTKIRTDMVGIGKDGKPFVVDNLKDWLFGVPGAHGNLQIMETDGVAFPPQTPEFAIKMIEQVLEDLAYPGVDERGE